MQGIENQFDLRIIIDFQSIVEINCQRIFVRAKVI